VVQPDAIKLVPGLRSLEASVQLGQQLLIRPTPYRANVEIAESLKLNTIYQPADASSNLSSNDSLSEGHKVREGLSVLRGWQEYPMTRERKYHRPHDSLQSPAQHRA